MLAADGEPGAGFAALVGGASSGFDSPIPPALAGGIGAEEADFPAEVGLEGAVSEAAGVWAAIQLAATSHRHAEARPTKVPVR